MSILDCFLGWVLINIYQEMQQCETNLLFLDQLMTESDGRVANTWNTNPIPVVKFSNLIEISLYWRYKQKISRKSNKNLTPLSFLSRFPIPKLVVDIWATSYILYRTGYINIFLIWAKCQDRIKKTALHANFAGKFTVKYRTTSSKYRTSSFKNLNMK